MKPEPPPHEEEPFQRRWWEDGCYCPPDRCVCGTLDDPFRPEGGSE
jgi:hypothetical protein